MAADAVQVAPDAYKVLFENDRVRLLEARLQPGATTAMRHHHDNLVYNLADGQAAFTDESGATVEVSLVAGSTMWSPAVDHSTHNTGSTEVRSLIFELKQPASN
ncbi:cytoplasmic protein [Streptomyces sp. 1331.2]|uniref:cytoplasmic protein n=1 Tax=Streptomyces sp. 1331.2 TaxID=1938835 RepID=UPI000BD21CE1|nr:cytoplasmic protein [Streptomyces sp. 1331.2]SOB88498.1 Mannose-6-phosphate isomerase, cupin superfamily [Streptomyces sp. 1331.2]